MPSRWHSPVCTGKAADWRLRGQGVIEVHPYFQQREAQAFGAQHGILTQAWAPIGGITFYRDSGHRSTLQDPVIGEIAKAHGKTPAQVMLRWHLQQGRQVIPKSADPRSLTLTGLRTGTPLSWPAGDFPTAAQRGSLCTWLPRPSEPGVTSGGR
jgi:hypothetical protein